MDTPMDTSEPKQHLLTNGYVEYENNPYPRFLVFNHKPQTDKPLFMNKRDMAKLFANANYWQERLVDTQAALDAGKIPSDFPPCNLAVFGKNCIRLQIQVYNEKAYLWLKLYYLKEDKWLPARGGLMISEKENFKELEKFVNLCA
jgi:hypothetical protein